MNFKTLLLSLGIFLFALQTSAQKKVKPKSSGCNLSAYASPATIEPGDSSNTYVYLTDSTTSSSVTSYTVAWLPSASVTSPDSSNTYAHPPATTTYTVTVNSSVCGTQTDTVTVYVGCTLTAGLTITPYYCAADGGTATAIASNGVTPYTYAWSNGQTTSSVLSLSVGSYSVLVKDSNGCSVTDTFSIVPRSVSVVASANPTTIEIGNYTTLNVFINDSSSTSSSSTSYTISWAPSATVTNDTLATTTANPKATTTYTVSVTTPCGVITDTVTVFIGCSVTASVTTTPYYCAANAGTATVTAANGVPPYTYLWSNGQTSSNCTGLTVGTYSVTVKDSNGCSTTSSCSISSSSLIVSASASPNSISLGDSTFLYVTVTDSSSTSSSSVSYTVSWSPSSSVTYPDTNGSYAHPDTTTTYTVTITTACGTITDTVTVFVTPCVNKFDQTICIVSIDTALDKNVIIWGRNDSPPDGSFNIYDSTSSGWTLIGTVPDTALSEYIDTASNPNTQSYNYRISTVDSCGESALSPVNSTIFLQVVQYPGNDSLYWSPYVGFTTPIYYIYRGSSLATLMLLDSVPGTTLSYIDYSPPAGSIYMVVAVNPSGGCTPTHRFIRHGVDFSTAVSYSNGGIPHLPLGIVGISSPVNSLVISPNPGDGLFMLSYSLSKNEDIRISVIDEFGRTVYEKQINEQHTGTSKQLLDIENLADGIYSLRMITNEGMAVQKLVVLKK
ncbi:MAG TPA: T9SS type A sorting domain-containing protein [Bacteroidia bacterium]|nr:T9SS type A sorting domain-containing protein [Bacteroidia bacterium]